jgi:uncharacterized RDD family membrane protein YckC
MTTEHLGRISPIPRDARPYQGQTAGVVTRMAAAILDGVVVSFMLACGYAGWCILLFLLNPRTFTFPRPGLFFSLGAGLALAFVYLTVLWALSGRTYGDLVMGLRVLRRSGRRIRLPGAALRAAFCVVVPIGILWIPVGRDNRSLQDAFLGTKVVYDWQPRHLGVNTPAEPQDADDVDAGSAG